MKKFFKNLYTGMGIFALMMGILSLVLTFGYDAPFDIFSIILIFISIKILYLEQHLKDKKGQHYLSERLTSFIYLIETVSIISFVAYGLFINESLPTLTNCIFLTLIVIYDTVVSYNINKTMDKLRGYLKEFDSMLLDNEVHWNYVLNGIEDKNYVSYTEFMNSDSENKGKVILLDSHFTNEKNVPYFVPTNKVGKEFKKHLHEQNVIFIAETYNKNSVGEMWVNMLNGIEISKK